MPISVNRITAALSAADVLLDVHGDLPEEVSSVADDSRQVTRDGLFIAIRGTEHDGHDFLERARETGASASIVEDASRTEMPRIVVRDRAGRRAAAIAAAVAYGWPMRELRVIGVTGTNGKTTTVHILRHLLDDPEHPSASIGTVGVLVGSEGRELEGGAGLTTPGPVELQRVLRVLADGGVRRIAMEVSSHALHQGRVEGLEFDIAIFTTFSRDHLDYHRSMENYLRAKTRLLDYLAPHGTVVVNADDPTWRSLTTIRRKVSFSARAEAEVYSDDVRFSARGSTWRLCLAGDRARVELPLIGDFNMSNALAAAAAAFATGLGAERIASRLAHMPQVPGRLEVVSEDPTILRDYAHTPEALERALAAVRPLTRGRLLVVFGCGGDRDRGKRPEMGRIAERLADSVILTSDNPRTEDPERILDDIEAGMQSRRHERIEDRREAIARAISLARPEDVILLAGKGHETYQIRGTEKIFFDEKVIVRELTRVQA